MPEVKMSTEQLLRSSCPSSVTIDTSVRLMQFCDIYKDCVELEAGVMNDQAVTSLVVVCHT